MPARMSKELAETGRAENCAGERLSYLENDRSRVNGEGDCSPGKNDCEFLRLGDGDSAYLRFADGERYVITVKEIYFKRVPESELK